MNDGLVPIKEAGRILGMSPSSIRRNPEVMAERVMVPGSGRRRREVPRWRRADLFALIERWKARTQRAAS